MNGLIAAISTVPHAGGRSIVRLSGPGAVDAAAALLDDAGAVLNAPAFSSIEARLDGLAVDVFVFRSPASYTREDLAEIHLPAGGHWADDVLGRAVRAGARLAEPGEFTRRAFQNGRISLAAAEGVLALVSARGKAAARAGLRLLSGHAPPALRLALDDLRRLHADLAASLDFPEEDIDIIGPQTLIESLARIRVLLGRTGGGGIDGGASVVFLGDVNAGKTTLFNRLAARDAIVSEIPGTTRDALYAVLRLAGRDVTLVDLPGLAAAGDFAPLTARLAAREASSADMVLLCAPADASPAVSVETRSVLAHAGADALIVVVTKCDLAGSAAAADSAREAARDAGLRVFRTVDSKPGDSRAVLAALTDALSSGRFEPGLVASVALQRAVAETLRLVTEASDSAAAGGLDICSSLLNRAVIVLEEPFIQGSGHGSVNEALLHDIFSRFCVGK